MASLTELVASRMTPEVMQKLAGLAGISSPDAKRAIDALIPTQVYDLVSMGATEAGVHRLLSLLKEQQGTESFAHVLLAGEALQSQARAGDALQSVVYGPDLSRRIGTSYTQRLAQSGLGYEQYAPAFRFGHSLAATEPFRRQRWETIELDVRRLWEEKNPGTWAQLKDAIQFSWERVRGAR